MFINRLLKVLKDEKGQNLLEFALIFPILIIITVGGIYLSISFIQKSVINGITFMEARSASVRGDPQTVVKSLEGKYKKSYKQNWIKKVNSRVTLVKKDRIKVQTKKPGSGWALLAGAISHISGGAQFKDKGIVSVVSLSREYFTSKMTGSSRPQTYTTVDYEHSIMGSDVGSLVEVIKDIVDACPNAIFNSDQMVDKESDKQSKDKIIGSRPLNINISNFCENNYKITKVLGSHLKLISGSEEEEPRKFSEKPGKRFSRMKTIGALIDTFEDYTTLTVVASQVSGFASWLSVVGELADAVGGVLETSGKFLIKFSSGILSASFDNTDGLIPGE